MKHLFAIITIAAFASCNAGNNHANESISSETIKKDTLDEGVVLSSKHQEAKKDIVGVWKIYKDISRDGDKCDSTSINNGTCMDRNTEMLTLVTFEEDGKFKLKSGFKGNHPSEDNGTWKISGTKYGIDLLFLESHTTKAGVDSSAENAITTYIIQNISFQYLVLIDAAMFNTMYFVPDHSSNK